VVTSGKARAGVDALCGVAGGGVSFGASALETAGFGSVTLGADVRGAAGGVAGRAATDGLVTSRVAAAGGRMVAGRATEPGGRSTEVRPPEAAVLPGRLPRSAFGRFCGGPSASSTLWSMRTLGLPEPPT